MVAASQPSGDITSAAEPRQAANIQKGDGDQPSVRSHSAISKVTSISEVISSYCVSGLSRENHPTDEAAGFQSESVSATVVVVGQWLIFFFFI